MLDKRPELIELKGENRFALLCKLANAYLIREIESSEGKAGTVQHRERTIDRFAEEIDRISRREKRTEIITLSIVGLIQTLIGVLVGYWLARK